MIFFAALLARWPDVWRSFFGSRKLEQDDALRLPCPLMAVRTPGDEASGLIGLGQGLERAFHLAAGWLGALGPWFKRLCDCLVGRPASFRHALLVAVPVYLLIGVALVVINGWVRGIQQPPWEEVLGWAVGAPGFAVGAASIALILPWVFPGLALSLFAGREALALPGITGVDAEPLPFADPESLMTLVIDVKAGRKQMAGLNHSLHEVRRIRLRIACWIRRTMNTVIDLERQISALPAAERERLATAGPAPYPATTDHVPLQQRTRSGRRDVDIVSLDVALPVVGSILATCAQKHRRRKYPQPGVSQGHLNPFLRG